MARCHQCGASNREGTKFCTSCGAPLSTAPARPSGGDPYQGRGSYRGGGYQDPYQQGGGYQDPYQQGGGYQEPYQQGGRRGGNYPQPYQGGGYGQPQPQSFFSTDPISKWTYAGMLLLAGFFPIGVIVAFVFGFGESTAPDFKRFCKYYLLFSPIGFIMALVYTFGSESDYNLKTLATGWLIVWLVGFAIGLLWIIFVVVLAGSFLSSL